MLGNKSTYVYFKTQQKIKTIICTLKLLIVKILKVYLSVLKESVVSWYTLKWPFIWLILFYQQVK